MDIKERALNLVWSRYEGALREKKDMTKNFSINYGDLNEDQLKSTISAIHRNVDVWEYILTLVEKDSK